jgi:hypothetical protein
MGQMIRLVDHDPRITRLCHEVLPAHPSVADWVARELRAAGASVLVAQVVCDCLAEVEPRAPCSPRRVERLSGLLAQEGVYAKAMAWTRQHDPDGLSLSVDIISRIIGAEERVEQLKNLEDGQLPSYRTPLAIRNDGDAPADFAIIFNHAYAMLRGVPSDILTGSSKARAGNS